MSSEVFVVPSQSCQTVEHYYVQVREELETKAGKKFVEFLAIEYSTQVVAGTNYFVKVRLCMCKV